jgi:hypothetical protein
MEEPLPREFFDRFVEVISDEARHFSMVRKRLGELGSFYGALPAHAALWQYGVITKTDMLSRLALVPMVQEARGLDAGPRLVQRLKSDGDVASAEVVAQIVLEEQGHVHAGVDWFTFMCERDGLEPGPAFKECVLRHLPSGLIAPFNELARECASFPSSWYNSCVLPKEDTNTAPAVPVPATPSTTTEPVTEVNVTGRKVIVVAAVFPEPRSTAAGVRTWAILRALVESGQQVWMCSPGKLSGFSTELEALGVTVVRCQPNSQDFDDLVASVKPNVVIFDQYTVHPAC